MMCAAALGNFGNIESAEASAENGTGKVLEIEKTQEPLRICVEEENADVLCQVITAWQKMYDGGQAELLVIPSGEEASEQKVQEIRKTIASGGGPDLFLTESPNHFLFLHPIMEFSFSMPDIASYEIKSKAGNQKSTASAIYFLPKTIPTALQAEVSSRRLHPAPVFPGGGSKPRL